MIEKKLFSDTSKGQTKFLPALLRSSLYAQARYLGWGKNVGEEKKEEKMGENYVAAADAVFIIASPVLILFGAYFFFYF